MAVSIPRAVICDAIGFDVTVETTDGTQYRGRLESVDRLLNIRLALALVQTKSGEYSAVGNTTVAGSTIKFVSLPRAMRDAPFFKDVVSGSFTARRRAAAGKRRPATK